MSWISVKDGLPIDDPKYDMEDVLICYRKVCDKCLQHNSEFLSTAVGYCYQDAETKEIIWEVEDPFNDDYLPKDQQI